MTMTELKWAGHISRMHDDRWTAELLNWCSQNVKRRLGRPPKYWKDAVKEECGGS